MEILRLPGLFAFSARNECQSRIVHTPRATEETRKEYRDRHSKVHPHVRGVTSWNHDLRVCEHWVLLPATEISRRRKSFSESFGKEHGSFSEL